jgi:hypothetical protein
VASRHQAVDAGAVQERIAIALEQALLRPPADEHQGDEGGQGIEVGRSRSLGQVAKHRPGVGEHDSHRDGQVEMSHAPPQSGQGPAEEHLPADAHRDAGEGQVQSAEQIEDPAVLGSQPEVVADTEHHHVEGQRDGDRHAQQQGLRAAGVILAVRPQPVAEALYLGDVVVQRTARGVPHQVHLAQRRIDAQVEASRLAAEELLQ